MAAKTPTLFLAFADAEESKLPQLKAELQAIEDSAKYLELFGQMFFEKQPNLDFARLFDLLDAYRHPDVTRQMVAVHFAGHAEQSAIKLGGGRLHTDDGKSFWESMCQKGLELFFLNACATSGQVEALKAAGIRAIIFTEKPVGDSKAKRFAQTFYTSLLGNRCTLQEAFDRANSELNGAERSQNQDERGFGPAATDPKPSWQLYTQTEADKQWRFPFAKPFELDGAIQRISGEDQWIRSLQDELKSKNVAVGSRPRDTFQHFGWLVEVFMRKIQSRPGRELTLRRLSFLVGTYRSSLRYLCYIQVAQSLKGGHDLDKPPIKALFNMPSEANETFDYLSLLRERTDCLKALPEDLAAYKVEGMNKFVKKLFDEQSPLAKAALYLEDQGQRLLRGDTIPDGELIQILENYLSALVYWLRETTFLVKYRLVSIKEIKLRYRLGINAQFIHEFGVLHGTYNEDDMEQDYQELISGANFTYNHSVLLLSGNNAEESLHVVKGEETFLSLSPLVIDLNIFEEKNTQTPEIYCFAGYNPKDLSYTFWHCSKEFDHTDNAARNDLEVVTVMPQNLDRPKLNDFYTQIAKLFGHTKTDDDD